MGAKMRRNKPFVPCEHCPAAEVLADRGVSVGIDFGQTVRSIATTVTRPTLIHNPDVFKSKANSAIEKNQLNELAGLIIGCAEKLIMGECNRSSASGVVDVQIKGGVL
jgi:hypothetical protein